MPEDDKKKEIEKKLKDLLGEAGKAAGDVAGDFQKAAMGSTKTLFDGKPKDGSGKEGWEDAWQENRGDTAKAATGLASKTLDTTKGMAKTGVDALLDKIPDHTFIGNDKVQGMLQKGIDAGIDAGFKKLGSFVEEKINDLFDGKHIGTLNIIFMTWNDQDKKLVYDQWHVEKVSGRELIGEPYEIFADLSARKGADPDTLLGTSVWVFGRRSKHADKNVKDEDDKYFHLNENDDISWGGWCGIVDQLDKTSEGTIRVRVVPAFAALKHRRNTRIFQDKTVPQILDEVLKEAFEPFKREATFKLECAPDEYPKREYCVQFDETDLDFVSRLMQEEGLAFYFRQPTDHPNKLEQEDKVFGSEALVITDQFAGFDTVRTRKQVDEEFTNELEFNTNRGNRYHGEAVQSLKQIKQRGTRKVVTRAYDWTNPTQEIKGEAETASEDKTVHEVYSWNPKLSFGKYNEDNGAYEENDVDVQTKVRLGGELIDDVIATGTSRVADFMPGLVFKLLNHPTQEFKDEYIITAVRHTYDSKIDRDGEKPGTYDERYTNEFEAIPTSPDYPVVQKFVPPRKTARPRVYGIQTALVVGPEGDDTIYTDQFGRIKVQFHWDRLGEKNEKSSCWIRVGQNMAGNDFGFVFTPRIGMEVIVQFIDGDPDRPIVTGALYNGQNRPPITVDGSAREDGYANDWSQGSEPETADSGKKLPDTKTRSFIRTRSMPAPEDDPNAFNEISFEDAAGSEQIFVQAQKDYVEFVKHDHKVHIVNDDYESVDNDQRVRVGNNREKTVDNDEKTRVAGNRTEEVFKDETITVKGKRTETVKKSESISIDGDRSRTVGGKDTVTVEKTREVKVTGDVKEQYEAKHELKVTSDQTITVDGKRTDTVKNDITMKSTSSKIVVDSKGTATLTLDGTKAELNASSNIKLVVGGSTIEMSASAIKLSLGPSSIELGPAGVKVNGVQVDIAGSAKTSVSGGAMTEVKGGIVKIN